ncbi:MAG TPA: substrate-binding domain-containing protein [Spirochaetia bacterium]|nr:substrate-binding domain-containing protein [Spirochaetia bacterium]
MSIRLKRALVLAIAVTVGGEGLVVASPQKEGEARYTAASIPRFKAPWFDRMETGMKKAGAELRVTVREADPPPADSSRQVGLIEDAINQGNDAIMVVPDDPRLIESVFAHAQTKKIVTVTTQSPHQAHADCDVEMVDDESFGQLAMEEMVKAMRSPEGEYAVFVGSFTTADHNRWADAAIARAKETYPGLTLAAERFPVSEDQGLSHQTALDIIAAYPNIKAFISFGSQGGPGIAQALRDKGLVGEVAVISTTGPAIASPYLRDGSLSASIVWDPAEAGFAMVYLARLVLDGKRAMIGRDLDIPMIGKPFSFSGNTVVYNRPLVLTKDNVEEYSGF